MSTLEMYKQDLLASMGPRSVERGNGEAVLLCLLEEFCFNGATLGRAWKLFDLQCTTSLKSASMGPRSVERGNRIE